MIDKRILLVEDNSDDEFLVLRTLKRTRLTNVIVRRDGCEGIEYLRSASETGDSPDMPFPELVIVDLNMPRMNGIEMIREMRSDPYLKGVPVVVLSSSFNPRDIQACNDLGISGYIIKPAREDQIMNLLERMNP